MKLNCKQGDLAIIVGPLLNGPEHAGKIVRCVEALGVLDGEFYWRIVPSLRRAGGGLWSGCNDTIMRPINNPGDGETDEMLLLAGRPTGAAA